MKPALALVLLASASPLAAQVRPQPGNGNPHLQSVLYDPNQVVTLAGAPGYQLTVELAPDEKVETVSVGDSGAWQVSTNHKGDRLFIKPLLPGVETNMLVVTDARVYSFDLTPLFGVQPDMAYVVHFNYPSQASRQSEPLTGAEETKGVYRLRGDDSLKPQAMHDDGVHTYIEWPDNVALPAIYAVNRQGRETLVNGMMRDGVMVVDSVEHELVFRIDDRRVTASRVVPGAR